MKLIIQTDGGSRGNPGIAGGGVVVLDGKNQPIHTDHFPFGIKTNNEAEYLAVIEALKWLKTFVQKQTPESVKFVLDSKLVVEQLAGRWKIREARLRTLAISCQAELKNFKFPVVFSHVKREKNFQADLLANQAMDQAS